MKKYVNGQYIELTKDELVQIEDNQQQYLAYEAHRPLTQDEINTIFFKSQVNEIEIDDQTSLRMIQYYPNFEDIIGQTVKQYFKFVYQGQLYKTLQADLLIQEHYYPQTGTESLYVRIDEERLGNKYDPIPYSGNMELFKDKYYTQDDILYLCTRDTDAPVYNTLSELVGLYTEIVN